MPAKFALFPVDENGRPILPFDEQGRPIPPDKFVIKLSKNLKPFVSRVVTSGESQRRFAERYGKPVGDCVKSKLSGRTGLSSSEVHDVVRDCQKSVRRHFEGIPISELP